MKMEINRNLREIFSDRPIFDRRQRSVEILRQLKLSDVQDFYRETYHNLEKQPSLMIQRTKMEVVKSSADFKSYRFIKLRNGLRVMLISSLKPGVTAGPGTDSHGDALKGGEQGDSACYDKGYFKMESQKSAAALCVNVGYFSDPVEAQGLAHFLEHMVFMGSEKYPRENDFDDYIKRCGGSTNACTDGDYTLFFFDIQRLCFREALDKFANFFIAPLLSQDCVDRELEAVHSEFEASKLDDSRRLGHLMASFAKAGSPYRTFGFGNRTSLRDKPMDADTNVYELLREFQLRYYNASLMTLAVESKDTLDHLESMVKEVFSPIPNRNCEAPDLSVFVNPFPSTVYKKMYKVCPVKETVSITFIWSLPPMHSHYRSAALKFVASIVGHQGRGSLVAYLRKLNLAVELNAGCSVNDSTHHNQMTSLFGISINLSEFSRTAPTTVADYVFSYLHMLRDAADFSLANPSATITPWGDRTFASLVPEFEKVWASNFRFLASLEPLTNVQTIAMAMRKFPPHEVFIADSLILEPDLKAYVDVARYLTPEKAIIAVSLPEFNAYSISDTREEVFYREPWFDIRYAVDEISDEQIQQWQDSPILPDFHLPEVNRFITNDFELLPQVEDNEVPVELSLGAIQPFGELWHQQRVKFNVPTAHVTVHIYSDVPQQAKDVALLRLWSGALNQRLQTLLYCANEAGLSYSVAALDRGLEIVVGGFNEKLLLLYQAIVDVLAQPVTGNNEERCLFNEGSFAIHKDRLRQMTCDQVLKPCKLNTHLKNYFQQVDIHLLEDCMKALEGLTLKDMVVFVPTFLSRIYIKAFVYGNIPATVTKRYIYYTLSKLTLQDVAVLKPYPKAALPACLNRLRVMNFDKTDVNTFQFLMSPLRGTPSHDLRYEVMNEVLEVCLRESACAYLRTWETLGYTAGLCGWLLSSTTGQCGLSLYVGSQANKFDSNVVAGRMYAFWYRIMPYIVFHLKEEAFRTAVEVLIAANPLEDATMKMEINRNLREIFSDRPIFDRRQRSVEILRQLKLSDVQDFYRETYHNLEKQPSLMIQVDSLSDVVPVAAFSRGGSAKVLKTFDWPLCIVPMSGDQAEAERSAALAVDVREAVRVCAPNLVTDAAKGEPNADFSIEEERAEVALPRFVEISDVRHFKHKVLFPLPL
uniref:Nardilysin n=1 Tax=Echinococcus granulosus TaxID=6210 RepID=A0A068X1I6_ECHGR|nr:nardilysin [Echinococcus granulosus]